MLSVLLMMASAANADERPEGFTPRRAATAPTTTAARTAPRYEPVEDEGNENGVLNVVGLPKTDSDEANCGGEVLEGDRVSTRRLLANGAIVNRCQRTRNDHTETMTGLAVVAAGVGIVASPNGTFVAPDGAKTEGYFEKDGMVIALGDKTPRLAAVARQGYGLAENGARLDYRLGDLLAQNADDASWAMRGERGGDIYVVTPPPPVSKSGGKGKSSTGANSDDESAPPVRETPVARTTRAVENGMAAAHAADR